MEHDREIDYSLLVMCTAFKIGVKRGYAENRNSPSEMHSFG